jgi:CHAT domain-containing protein
VKIYPNEKATTTTFRSALDQYDILHLGLHAYADTTGRQRHGIVFPGDKTTLQVSDLIGRHIRASIVFLEGCETGVGKQLRGEGLLNFARSFIAAGARRWKLHDLTAGEMSGYFYQELKAGSDVAVANCEAKRMFLKSAGALQSHPYYWAAVMSVQ